MHIEYFHDKIITTDEFVDVLKRSTLAERRPVDDLCRMKRMLENAGLLVTAWDNDLLVGIARSVTDFSYCCYLSDLAVDLKYQRCGIGSKLVERTREVLDPKSSLILLSAPAAMSFYPKIGMKKIENGFIFKGLS